ncbi:hypothetical protein WCP94_002875 [Bilophila wadsworthia]
MCPPARIRSFPFGYQHAGVLSIPLVFKADMNRVQRCPVWSERRRQCADVRPFPKRRSALRPNGTEGACSS